MALSNRRLISSLSTMRIAAGTAVCSSKKALPEECPTSKGVVIEIFSDIDDRSGVGSPYGSIVRKKERFNIGGHWGIDAWLLKTGYLVHLFGSLDRISIT